MQIENLVLFRLNNILSTIPPSRTCLSRCMNYYDCTISLLYICNFNLSTVQAVKPAKRILGYLLNIYRSNISKFAKEFSLSISLTISLHLSQINILLS